MSAEGLFSQLLCELCIEISFRSFQKQMTINSTCPHCNQQCELLNEKAGLDIYGNRIDSNGGIISNSTSTNATSANSTVSSDSASSNSGMITVECPCCKKVLAATRFAPHLEKCMGMGRQSARKRGNLMMKMAAGSENESDDASETPNILLTRTPALQINEDNFGANGGGSDPKKAKVSPGKSKTPASASNSKSNSPSKAKKAANTANSTTPSKSKASASNNKK